MRLLAAELSFNSLLRRAKRIMGCPGRDHGKNHLVSPDQYRQRIIDFFDRYLQNESVQDSTK